jgi:hypothetical protein
LRVSCLLLPAFLAQAIFKVFAIKLYLATIARNRAAIPTQASLQIIEIEGLAAFLAISELFFPAGLAVGIAVCLLLVFFLKPFSAVVARRVAFLFRAPFAISTIVYDDLAVLAE